MEPVSFVLAGRFLTTTTREVHFCCLNSPQQAVSGEKSDVLCTKGAVWGPTVCKVMRRLSCVWSRGLGSSNRQTLKVCNTFIYSLTHSFIHPSASVVIDPLDERPGAKVSCGDSEKYKTWAPICKVRCKGDRCLTMGQLSSGLVLTRYMYKELYVKGWSKSFLANGAFDLGSEDTGVHYMVGRIRRSGNPKGAI